MKLLRSFLLFLSAAFIIVSCQKELSFEEGTARGTLKEDATGECLPATVVGSYKRDTLLNTSNYVDIQVDITQTGTYVIKTDTLNGYSFSATGVAAVAGLNTIRLQASGRPVAAALDVFRVKFDTTSCEINIVVTGSGGGGGGGTVAAFTFAGTAGPCTGAVQSGTYTSGIAMNPATNFITIPVTVQTAGTYSVISTTVNNVTFSSGAGVFSSAGPSSIILRATGTPSISATPVTSTNYAIVATNTCNFDVTYAATPAPAGFTFNCPAVVANGTYQQGVAMAPSNTLTVPVTVTSGGSYNISSVANGVTFSGSGILPATPAAQTITLNATGTNSTTAGPVAFTLIGGGGANCSVNVTFSGAPTASTDSIVATINGVYTTFKIRDTAQLDNTTLPGYAAVAIFGENNVAGDESFALIVAKLGPSITPGTYTVNQFPAAVVVADYTTLTSNFSTISDFTGTPQTPGFTIVISSITSTRVIGTFSGRLLDGGTGPGFKTVSGGIFSVAIYP